MHLPSVVLRYNYRWRDGKKVNTAAYKDLVDGVVFVNAKVAFRLTYLNYHASLQFRGYTSSNAIAWSFEDALAAGPQPAKWVDKYRDAQFYVLAMQEFEPLNLHLDITIGDELTDESLAKYDEYMHNTGFPPESRTAVRELCGHEKVIIKCTTTKPPKK